MFFIFVGLDLQAPKFGVSNHSAISRFNLMSPGFLIYYI